jgi:hypothetical protein
VPGGVRAMMTGRICTTLWGLSLLAAVVWHDPLRAQTIVGVILDDLNSAPLPVTSLMLLDSTDTAVAWAESDSVGRFVLRAPRFGRFRLFADRLGYGEIVSDILALGDTYPVDVEVRMVPLPLELDAVVVTAERRRMRLDQQGFYRRRERAFGTFFDTDEIRALHPTRTTDILRRVPGVVVRRNLEGGAVATTWRRGRSCPMKVVLDGFKIDTSVGSLDDWVSAASVIGVEVFPGGVGAPVQHRGTDAFCGVVMIWTR